MSYDFIDNIFEKRHLLKCRIAFFFVTEAVRKYANDALDFNNFETRAFIRFFPENEEA